jgi:hypothetical protein
VRGLAGHQAARFAGTGAGFGVSAIVGAVSSTIALMKIIGNQNNKGMTRTLCACLPLARDMHCNPNQAIKPHHSRLYNVLLLVPVPVAGPTPMDSQNVMSLMEPEQTRALAAS